MLPYCHYCDSINDVKKFTKVAYRCLKCKKVFFIKSKSIDPYRPSPDLRGETKEEHMGFIIKEGNENTFSICPAGIVNAVCYSFEDIGMQETEWEGKKRSVHQGIILFEVEHRIPDEGEYKGKRYIMPKWYTVSLDVKANFRKDLDVWRGRPFTKEELEGFDSDNLKCVKCTLNITHKPKKDGDLRAVITSIMPAQIGNEMAPELTDVPEWVKKIQIESGVIDASFDEGVDKKEETKEDLPF